MCLTPWKKLDKMNGTEYILPCGRCPECAARRVSAWSFRLMQECKRHTTTSTHFITLTYDTDHVPISSGGFMSLSKDDIQKFFKRLRKSQRIEETKEGEDHAKIKYFLAGEYGGRTKRPHYHIILFNARINLLQSAWNLGSIHYGSISGASVGYTLKYINKGKQYFHANDDRLPEFQLMSKRLGDNYITPATLAFHQSTNDRMYLTLEGGQKVSMSRYFKDKIFSEEQRADIAALQQKRVCELIPLDEQQLSSAIEAAFLKQQKKAKNHDKL